VARIANVFQDLANMQSLLTIQTMRWGPMGYAIFVAPRGHANTRAPAALNV